MLLTGPGRPPSPTFDVNPAVFEDEKAKRSHNSQYPSDDNQSDHIENIESAPAASENDKVAKMARQEEERNSEVVEWSA
jgi:hypothetical protein